MQDCDNWIRYLVDLCNNIPTMKSICFNLLLKIQLDYLLDNADRPMQINRYIVVPISILHIMTIVLLIENQISRNI